MNSLNKLGLGKTSYHQLVSGTKLLANEASLADNNKDAVSLGSAFLDLDTRPGISYITTEKLLGSVPHELESHFGQEPFAAHVEFDGAGDTVRLAAQVGKGEDSLSIRYDADNKGGGTYRFEQLGSEPQAVYQDPSGNLVLLEPDIKKNV